MSTLQVKEHNRQYIIILLFANNMKKKTQREVWLKCSIASFTHQWPKYHLVKVTAVLISALIAHGCKWIEKRGEGEEGVYNR